MEDYKYIRIDMDYCASPVWVSTALEDGFMNGGYDDLPVLPKTLQHALYCYQRLWELSSSSAYWQSFNNDESNLDSPELLMLDNVLSEMVYKCAIEVKKHNPDKRVYVWKDGKNFEII